MDGIARIRAEAGYAEDGEPQDWPVIERYIELLEAHARAMEMVSVPPQPQGAVEALRYYAKPRSYGSGEHSVFLDDCGVAKRALDALGGGN